MSKSIGLALYLLAAARAAETAARDTVLPELPTASQRVWLHAPGGDSLPALCAVACRLHALRPTLGLILTHPDGARPAPDSVPHRCMLHTALPEDPDLLRAVIGRWGPSVLVLGDDTLAPALIHEVEGAGVPIFLINARAPRMDGSWRAWPGLQRTLLRKMTRILVQDATSLAAFRRAGVTMAKLENAGPMSESPGALPCNAAERDALARLLGVRPVWLAVAVPEQEEDAVLAAQRAAQRIAHRLLLLLVPRDPARGTVLAEKALAMGMRAARRGAEEEPSDHDQIYIADSEGELGLWYRLSPVTFMGGTLIRVTPKAGQEADTPPSAVSRSPHEPAALGSAIICGPHTRGHEAVFERLAGARALRRVSGAVSLADAVTALLAPDRAALMAQAAWNVSTQGAEATDRAADLILAALDESRR